MFIVYISRWKNRVLKCLRLLLVLAMLTVLISQLWALLLGRHTYGEREKPLRVEEPKETPAAVFTPENAHTHWLERLWEALEKYYRGR